MKCPHCGSGHVISNITIRWSQPRGTFRPERGHFCTKCGRPFRIKHFDFGFRTVRVEQASPAHYSLQRSGDVVVVRYRNGIQEILF